jgi:Tfp pilus assembly protein PilV
MRTYYHLDIMQKSGSKTRPQWTREQGLALIEVVMTSFVLGIAVVGVALMFSLGRSFTVAQGDNRVAFYLAQEKLENLRAQGFAAVPINPGGACPGITCYNESDLTAGADNTQTFLRVTSVDCVAKSNLNTVISCPTPKVLKRITVTVTPSMHQADPVILQTVLACQQC